MNSFEDHVKWLVVYLLAILGIFIVAYSFDQTRVWQALIGTTVIIAVVIFILVRYGGEEL